MGPDSSDATTQATQVRSGPRTQPYFAVDRDADQSAEPSAEPTAESTVARTVARDGGRGQDGAQGAAGLDKTRAAGEPGAHLDETLPRDDPRATREDTSATRASALGPSPELMATAAASPGLDETRAGAAPHLASGRTVAQGPEATLVSGADPSGPRIGDLPRKIGRFVVLRGLGSGGMGTVYAAFDDELARRVAIKVLHRGGLAATQSTTHLHAEAQAMARLSHPNVVQVYELGEHEGQIFLVMEFVEGQTLTEWLEADEDRPWAEILALFIAAGEGIAAAHRAGIVHRDFKPDNVLISADGVPRVADFGLAHGVADGVRQIAGTPAYMSPEQFLGEATDTRSDIFSLCVALYAALYGEPPFAGETFEELRERVTSGEVAPPPARAPGPGRLRTAILRGLARDPDDRYENAEALLEALRAFVPSGVNPWPARLAWVAALAMTAFGVAWILDGSPGPSPADVARIADGTLVASRCGARAEWVYPAEADGESETSIRRIVALEHVTGPATELARHEADRLRVSFAAQLAKLGEHYWKEERTQPFARDFYAQALIFQPDHPTALKRGNFTVGQLAQLRDQAESRGFSSEQLAAVAPLRILANIDDPDLEAKLAALLSTCDTPPSLASSSGGSRARGEHSSSAARGSALFAPAAEESDATPSADRDDPQPDPNADPGAAPDSDPHADPEAPPGEVPAAVGEPALDETPAASPAPPRKPRSRSRGNPDSLIAQAENARRRGQDVEAKRLFAEALAIAPRSSTALAALSDIAFDRGDFREAAKLATQAIQASPSIAEHHTRLGDAYFKLKRMEEARGAYARAVELGDSRVQRRLDLMDGKASG